MQALLLIAGGGALGSVSRYWLTQWTQALLGHGFPYGTLAVNVFGCLLAGAVYGLIERGSDPAHAAQAFLIVGFMGGFTTFSAFSLATLQLLQRGEPLQAVVNVLASLLLSLAACGLGLWLTERWH